MSEQSTIRQDPEVRARDQATGETAVDRPLKHRTCLVTGASRGIGRAIATRLAAAGATVAINYNASADAADTVLESVEDLGSDGMTVQADVADYQDVEAMAETVHEDLGDIDVLVNNAGINIDKKFEHLEPADWQRVLRVNLEGAFNVTSAFYGDLAAAPEGRIINISSVNGERGSYGQSNYSASKTGLVGFTRSLAAELAPQRTTVNVVAPGYTRTDMVEGMREDIKDRIKEQIPLDRFAEPREIAHTVSFLASDEARYITGEVLNVNGGLYP